MKKVLLLVAGNNGTIGSCSLNLYNALKTKKDVVVRCAVIHRFPDGYDGFNDAIFFDDRKYSSSTSRKAWLRNLKKDFNPDVTISTLFGVSSLSVLSGGKDKKIGIFHSPHQQMKAAGTLKYLLSLLHYSFIYPRLDKLCCVSQEVKESLNAFPWICDKKKCVVYNVHDTDHIVENSHIPITDEKEKEIFSHPCLVYCGRLDRNKAPLRAIEAFAKAARPDDAQLVFIGEDQQGLTEELMTLADRLGIADRLHFIGRKQNPYPYFKAAKALVSCSYSEGLPGVIIESLAIGTPVVTTNSSKGIWEIFSCLPDYNVKLQGLHYNEYGIISSNLAHRDISMYETDISNLASAISQIWMWPRISKFKFGEMIKGDKIIDQLLKGL
jgi:glycosyltransferase, family 1